MWAFPWPLPSASPSGLKHNEILHPCPAPRDSTARIPLLGPGKGWGREADGGTELLNWSESSATLPLLAGGWHVAFCSISPQELLEGRGWKRIRNFPVVGFGEMLTLILVEKSALLCSQKPGENATDEFFMQSCPLPGQAVPSAAAADTLCSLRVPCMHPSSSFTPLLPLRRGSGFISVIG